MLINRTPFEVSIPVNLDAESILPEGLKPQKAAKLIDGIHYFLNLLFPKPTERKKRKMLEQEGFIRLKAVVLKHIIGPEYKQIRELLEAQQIIQVDMQFVLGKKTRGYRISERYFIASRQAIITNGGIRKRHHAFIAEAKKEQQVKLKNLTHITNWLNKNHISIDVDAAHDFVEIYRIKMLELCYNTTYTSNAHKEEARYRVLNRCYYQKYVVKTIDEGSITCSRDNSGRLYTPLVSLKKELRNFVLLEGQKTGSIDIKSSQPYLFTKLLDKAFWQTKPSTPISLYKIHKEKYIMVNETELRNNIITLLNSYGSVYGIGLERIPFKNIEWENDFYSQLRALIARKTGDQKILKCFETRAAVKKAVMLILFDLFHIKKPPYYQGFKLAFEDELALMDKIKTHPVKNLFATMLQAVEATIVLDRTCKDISERYPQVPILTIHDSVVCGTQYLDPIKETMRESLQEHVGIQPGLKIEVKNIDQVMSEMDATVASDWNELLQSLKKNKNKDWMSTFNEEPKEIPLRNRMMKIDGRIYLDKRMVFVDDIENEDQYEADFLEEADATDEYYQWLESEYEG